LYDLSFKFQCSLCYNSVSLFIVKNCSESYFYVLVICYDIFNITVLFYWTDFNVLYLLNAGNWEYVMAQSFPAEKIEVAIILMLLAISFYWILPTSAYRELAFLVRVKGSSTYLLCFMWTTMYIYLLRTIKS